MSGDSRNSERRAAFRRAGWRIEKAQEAAKNFYQLGVEVEKIAQGVGYAVETVKGWLGIEL